MVRLFRQMTSRSFTILLTALFITISLLAALSSINRSTSNTNLQHRSPENARNFVLNRTLPSSSTGLIAVRDESPADLALYNSRIEKGRLLACLMASTLEQAPTFYSGYRVEALVQNPAKFNLEGWRLYTGGRPIFEDSLNNVLDWIGVPRWDQNTNLMPQYRDRRNEVAGFSFIEGLSQAETAGTARQTQVRLHLSQVNGKYKTD